MSETFSSDTPSKGFVNVDGEAYLPSAALAKLFGVSTTQLQSWDTRCDYIGEGLAPIFRKSPVSGHEAKFYRLGIVELIQEKVREAAGGTFTNPKPVRLDTGEVIAAGQVWLSPAETMRRLRRVWKPKQEAMRALICHHIRSGTLRAIRYRFVADAAPGTARRGKPGAWCLEKDVDGLAQVIQSRKQSRRHRTGRASQRMPAPQDVFDGIFPGEGPPRYTVHRATRELNRILGRMGAERRCTTLTLYSYMKTLPADLREQFRDGRVPSEYRAIPGSHRRVESLSLTDMETLATAIVGVEIAARKGEGLHTSEDICNHFGVSRLGDRILVRQFLRKLEPNTSHARKGKRGKRQADLYDLSRVERALAGRSIVDLARQRKDELLTASKTGAAVLALVGDGWTTIREIQQRLPVSRTFALVRETLLAGARLGRVEREPPLSVRTARGSQIRIRWRKPPKHVDPAPGGASPPRRRGRPAGTTSSAVADRKRKMLDAWDRGDFASKAAAGRAHGFGRSDATKIIIAHERTKCRN
jgi:hypothetical protein